MEATESNWWLNADYFSQIAAELQKHVVGLLVVYPGDAKPRLAISTGILIEHSGIRLWVTAGHVLHELERAIEAYPEPQLKAFWIDNYLDTAESMIPLSLKKFRCAWIDEDGKDFGVVPLVQNHVQLLTADNRSTFLNPTSWMGNSSCQPEAYFLAGFPQERSGILRIEPIESDYLVDVKFDAMTIAVERIELAKPQSDHDFFRFRDAFYGKLVGFNGQQELRSIEGVSGGPIFAINREPNGSGYGYRLFGIQSTWLQSKALIRATPIESFDLAVRAAVSAHDRMAP